MTSPPVPASRRVLVVAIVALMIVVALLYLAFGLLTASTTLGCDYGSYSAAASRFLAGQPIYLPGPARTGECPLFPYPPPFVLIVLPFVWLGAAGMWAWIAAAWLSFAVGTAILPVERWVRVAVFMLGSIGWPLIYGVRIGQVVPLLYLVFAIGWNVLERDRLIGAVAGIGTLIKVQPGLLFVWLLGRMRVRAIVAGGVVMAAISGVAFLVGLRDWPEFARTVFQISNAADVPANLSIGGVLYRMGLDLAVANAVQTVNTVAILGITLTAARFLPPVPGYLAVVAATQVLTPIVWSHYALITLLPVAWLIGRRQWWAMAIPIAQAWMLITIVPDVLYPLSFYVAIAALFVVGRHATSDARPARQARPDPIGAAA